MGSKIKRFFTLVVFCVTVFSLAAQEFDWEDPRINWSWDNNRHTFTINAGYNSIVGILTRYTLIDIISSFAQNIPEEEINKVANLPYGNYGFQYHYNTHKWFRVGMKFSGDINRTNINDKTDYISYLNILASAQFTYYNENRWRVYSGIDAGMSIMLVPQSKNTLVLPALNITPVGFSYGRGFIVFAEINLGSDAVIKGGIGLRL